jgi:membrane peptidoglycan carboxypeptidase
MMAYSPNLVIGAWVGHTGPGNQDMNGVYGTMVGSSVLKDFINHGLTQAHFSVEAFKRPDGLIDGPPCANNANVSPSSSPSASPSASSTSAEKELYLPGTECKAAPTPSATPSPSPSDVLSPLPSIVPSGITPSPSPSPSPTPAPTATSTPGATPAKTP